MPRVGIPIGYSSSSIVGDEWQFAAVFSATIPPNPTMQHGGRHQVAFLPVQGSSSVPYTQFQKYELTYRRNSNNVEQGPEVKTRSPQNIDRATTPLQDILSAKLYSPNRARLGENVTYDGNTVVSEEVTARAQQGQPSSWSTPGANPPVEATYVKYRDKLDGGRRTFTRLTSWQHGQRVNNADGNPVWSWGTASDAPLQRLSILAATPELRSKLKEARPG